jgi:hypothetical protein
MIEEVTVTGLYSIKVIDIVQELKDLGLVQGDDFEFSYHSGSWDGMTGGYDRFTVFKFKEPATATWFRLKYIR